MTRNLMLRSRARRTVPLSLAVLALGLAACGGDDDEGADTTVESVTEATVDAGSDTTAVVPDGSVATTSESATSDTATPDTATPDTATGDTTTGDTTTGDSVTVDSGPAGTLPGDENDPEADEETFVAYGARELGFPDLEFSTCLSQALVDGVGFDNIAATDLSPVDFFSSSSLAETGVEVDDDVRALIQDNLVACGDLVESVAEASAVDEAGADCLRDNFTDELVAEQLVVGFADGTPSEELTAAGVAFDECRGS